MNRTVGGKKGWRLPSVHELASLVDPASPINIPFSDPVLPAGHPFSNVQLDDYWSATKVARVDDFSSGAWGVDFIGGFVTSADPTTELFVAWCVRGGGPLADY